MRVALGIVVLAGCSSSDTRVHVEMPDVGGSFGSVSVIFRDPSGETLPFTVDGNWWVASVPSGGSVEVGTSNGGSPSSIRHTSRLIEGVEPGDRFPLQHGPLPTDCQSLPVTLTPEPDGSSSWTDPDASAIDARITSVKSLVVMPFNDFVDKTIIDNSTETRVPFQASPMIGVTVTVVACAHSSWDDIRTLL